MKTFILALLISFASISGVLFTPALPSISTYFQVSESVGQWAMTIFLLGYVFGQLPYGPIANRFGRKKALYIGVILAIIGSFICLFASSFEIFLLGRFVQALGSSVGIKITYTMIGDQHKGPATTQMLSRVMLSFAIMPGLGTALGGFLTAHFGWQACFLFLALYSLFLGLLSLFLPETAHSLDKHALSNMGHALGKQFKDPFLVYHALLMSMASAIVYVLATAAPYIGIDQMGLTPDQYGLWYLAPSAGLALGFIASSHFSHRLSPRIAILSGILLSILSVIVMAGLFNQQILIPAALFIPSLFLMLGAGIFVSGASGKALSEATDKSSASAVMGFINIGGTTLLVYLIGIALPFPPIYLAAIFGTISLFAFGLWLKLKPHH